MLQTSDHPEQNVDPIGDESMKDSELSIVTTELNDSSEDADEIQWLPFGLG